MTSVDVVPLGDLKRHCIPEGYRDIPGSTAWKVIARRVDGLFPPCWCNPITDPRIYSFSVMAMIYIHQARDGREHWEKARAA